MCGYGYPYILHEPHCVAYLLYPNHKIIHNPPFPIMHPGVMLVLECLHGCQLSGAIMPGQNNAKHTFLRPTLQ